jgi:hypothetical protein
MERAGSTTTAARPSFSGGLYLTTYNPASSDESAVRRNASFLPIFHDGQAHIGLTLPAALTGPLRGGSRSGIFVKLAPEAQ